MRRHALLFGFILLGLVLAASPASAQVTPTITGTTHVYLYGYTNQYASWSASVTGGIPPYTYRWGFNGINPSLITPGPSTYGGTYLASNMDHTWTDVIWLHVTDKIGQTGITSLTVYGESYYDPCAQQPSSPWEYPVPIENCY